MRAFGILLVLFLWFAFCSAYPKKQDDSPNIDEGNALALLRQRRSTDPISSLAGSTMRLLSLSTEPVQSVTQMASSAMKFIMDWLIRVPLQMPMNVAVGLLHFMSSLFPNFFSYLPKTMDALRDYVRDQAISLLEKGMKLMWHFLSTTGLPWLRRILDRVGKMRNVPESVKSLIQGFDTLYSLAEIMGIVSRAY